MAGPADYTLRDTTRAVYTPSIGGTPVAAYIPVQQDALIIMTAVTPYGAITTADCTLTVAVLPAGVAANAVTVGGTVTVPLSGAAAGTFAFANHTTNRRVRKGDVIRITPAGASGASIAATISVRMRR